MNSQLCVQGAPPPTTRVRRLTKAEITSATTTILGMDTSSALANLDADAPINGGAGFTNSDGLVVSDSFANGLNLAAETIGTAWKATVTKTAYGSTCYGSDSAAATCATTFIQNTGKKIFRRVLTDDEVTALSTVYTAGRDVGTDGDVGDRFATGLSWVVRAMMQSPDFLYLTELGDPSVANGGKTTLTSDEIASALSFSILGMPPDDMLIAAAAANQLGTGDARAAQVDRLISAYPDAFKQQMRLFVPQWLGINFAKPEWDKDTTAVPMFTSDLKSALQTETNMFIDDWSTAGGAQLGALLTSSSTFVNSLTAPLYGVSVSGTAFVKTALDPTQRAGILTFGGFLGTTSHVAETSPVQRGKAIMQKFFCKDPPPPPPNVPPLPPVDQGPPTTTRARFDAHLADAACSNCHSQFDPMGNAFEEFDPIGAFRTQQNGFPIDSSGALVGATGGDKPVANAVELVKLLANSAQTNDCMTRQMFRFTVGRTEVPFDSCMITQTAQTLGADADLHQVIKAIVKSDSFVVRTVTNQ
jgi:Protein of unknown function (DUF1588)/Protein of unknown function (DUF1592)/Protein of unknown function (DUF1595)/Protein of unknown function (DUF1585)